MLCVNFISVKFEEVKKSGARVGKSTRNPVLIPSSKITYGNTAFFDTKTLLIIIKHNCLMDNSWFVSEVWLIISLAGQCLLQMLSISRYIELKTGDMRKLSEQGTAGWFKWTRRLSDQIVHITELNATHGTPYGHTKSGRHQNPAIPGQCTSELQNSVSPGR